MSTDLTLMITIFILVFLHWFVTVSQSLFQGHNASIHRSMVHIQLEGPIYVVNVSGLLYRIVTCSCGR